MDFNVDMRRFQEDSKKLENNLQQIRDYVGRINLLMSELSTGVRVLIERGALEKTEKKVNEEFMGYYKAIRNLEKYFGELAQNVITYDDKINASQQQRMESLRIELKALMANQKLEQEKAIQALQESLQKQQAEYIDKLETIREQKESAAVDRSVLTNIKHLMESLNCDAEKAMQLLKIPKRVRDKYSRLLNKE